MEAFPYPFDNLPAGGDSLLLGSARLTSRR